MLLEELLGISNKRLKYIFNGQSLDEDSSSSTSEDKPIDVISLDDISDDDLVINVDGNDYINVHINVVIILFLQMLNMFLIEGKKGKNIINVKRRKPKIR